jgi:hypothetical protein
MLRIMGTRSQSSIHIVRRGAHTSSSSDEGNQNPVVNIVATTVLSKIIRIDGPRLPIPGQLSRLVHNAETAVAYENFTETLRGTANDGTHRVRSAVPGNYLVSNAMRWDISQGDWEIIPAPEGTVRSIEFWGMADGGTRMMLRYNEEVSGTYEEVMLELRDGKLDVLPRIDTPRFSQLGVNFLRWLRASGGRIVPETS